MAVSGQIRSMHCPVLGYLQDLLYLQAFRFGHAFVFQQALGSHGRCHWLY